jgi:dTDP-glucose 4,6-dehydratase
VYDAAKRSAAAATMAYRRRYDVSVGIVRIFNTYGPRMRLDDGRVVPAFIDQALRNASLTVCGDGSQTRSFCYVSDLVEGVRRVIENPRVTGPINIGNPEEVSVLDLAHRIRDAVGSRSEIVFTERPEGDPMQRRPSIARARAELDWEPRVALAAGLATTIEHYRALATRSSGADAQRDAGRR